ncbi:MAG: hypothetical protein P4L67_00960 [Candidatus Pacebacteria bacterium]|nr:hypothetical protein [Candidatus Paceibacterota bacterium]
MASKEKDTVDKDAVAIDFEPLKEFTKNSFLQILSKVISRLAP